MSRYTTTSQVAARRLSATLALVVLLLLSACSTATPGTHAPAPANSTGAADAGGWKFKWKQAAGAASDSVRAVYQASAMARDPQGGLHTPAKTWWLATGPAFALALVQLDPPGRSIASVVLARGTELGPNWSLVLATQSKRPTAATGREIGSLPGGDYGCVQGNTNVDLNFSTAFCLSPSRMFLYGRFAQAAARPMGADTVTVNGREGWLAGADAEGFVNTVVVPLTADTTYVFGGTASGKQLVTLAAEMEGSLVASGT